MLFDYALKENFLDGLQQARDYFGVELEIGWNLGSLDTFYVYASEVNDGVTVIKWDQRLDLDIEITRLCSNANTVC